MGNLLAVKRHILALLSAVALASCGSDQPAGTAYLTGMAQQVLGTLGQSGRAPDAAAQPVPEFALMELNQPLMVARIASRNAVGGLSVVGRNQGFVTWQTGDGISLTLKNGVLASTRGLGADLMSADIAEVVRAIQAGAGTARRVHRYLDGENQLRPLTFVCDIETTGSGTINVLGAARSTREVTETCTSPDLIFTNVYWIGRDGLTWKARQFIGVALGHVELEWAAH